MNDELKGIVIASLFGAIGFMWVVGGIALVLAGFDEHCGFSRNSEADRKRTFNQTGNQRFERLFPS